MGLEFWKLPLVRDLVMQHEGRVETRSAQLAKMYSCRQQRMTLVPKDPKLMDIQGPEVSGKGKMSLPPTILNSPMNDPRPFSCTITPIRILASSEEPTNGRRQLSLSPARQGRRRVSSQRQKSKKNRASDIDQNVDWTTPRPFINRKSQQYETMDYGRK